MRTSTAPPTPPGEGAPAAGTQPALSQDEATTQHLLEAVLASDNLGRACKRVKSNKGAPGIDGVTVEDWPAHARAHTGLPCESRSIKGDTVRRRCEG